VHVRLGDYVGLPHHFDADLADRFYTEAVGELIARLPGDTALVVFCNDPPQRISELLPACAGALGAAAAVGRTVLYADEPDELVALYAMAACRRGHVVPNSTFSWWGAFLNPSPDKVVVAHAESGWLHDGRRAEIHPAVGWGKRLEGSKNPGLYRIFHGPVE
jgi:hypothetical protein